SSVQNPNTTKPTTNKQQTQPCQEHKMALTNKHTIEFSNNRPAPPEITRFCELSGVGSDG
ncbi:MAG: hypothetical protein FWD83_10825, partial [Promicromonosporaceae bacterium]|nr:hypothetical protein [Promicromonosporaceae bacterium]